MVTSHRLAVIAVMVFQCALSPAHAALAADASPPIVRTHEGRVRGFHGNGVIEYRGIPFAQPPVGALRFELPRPARHWSDVLDATAYREACPQARRFNLTEPSETEDCLHLNVAVPSSPHAGARPVLVWFYGGAFVGGSTKLYPLDYLAREGDMVVVSGNYRLGPLGFMAHPAFGAAFNGGYALEDQRAVLRWVQRNIAAFGGDPHDVTIGGVSAGAASVCMHLFTPERTHGLFEKAIIQSAGCTFPLARVDRATQAGLSVARLVGCSDAKTALNCLRSKSTKQLVDAGTVVAAQDYHAFLPAYGTEALPRDGIDAFRTGRFVHVPILNGGTRDEMRVYVGYEVAAGANISPATYRERLRRIYGLNTEAVYAAYPVAHFSSAPAALGSAMSDYMPGGVLNSCLFLRTAWLASKSVPVFQYEFADTAAPPLMDDPGFDVGVSHTAEMPYEFPGFSSKSVLDGPPLAPPSQELSRQMVKYWSAFVHTGRPDVPGLPAWKSFNDTHEALRLVPGHVGMFDASAAHQCPFWERLYRDGLSH
jgi:para-nitrobenzyl esterase